MTNTSKKMFDLCAIMERAHALADLAWPRNDQGVSPMPEQAMHLIIDIQQRAAKALGLPEDLDLMTGDPSIDL